MRKSVFAIFVPLFVYSCASNTEIAGNSGASSDWRAIFAEHINDDVRNGYFTLQEGKEIMEQYKIFDKNRELIESKYKNKIVAVANGNIYSGDSFEDIEVLIPKGHRYYFEMPHAEGPQAELAH
jgi:hypothetical protein